MLRSSVFHLAHFTRWSNQECWCCSRRYTRSTSQRSNWLMFSHLLRFVTNCLYNLDSRLYLMWYLSNSIKRQFRLTQYHMTHPNGFILKHPTLVQSKMLYQLRSTPLKAIRMNFHFLIQLIELWTQSSNFHRFQWLILTWLETGHRYLFKIRLTRWNFMECGLYQRSTSSCNLQPMSLLSSNSRL